MTAYSVNLASYQGPLDLLLYLIRRQEIDILDISISQVADQFLAYLDVIQELQLDTVGEFLVVAATLMEIKVRSLLPDEEAPAEREGEAKTDPRRELVRQLLEYRKFKEAAVALEQRAEQHTSRLARVHPVEPDSVSTAPAVRPVELWDLVSALARLMRETQLLQTTTINVDDTPQHVYEALVRERVATAGRLNFRDLFTPPYEKLRLIGLFLAMLELIKQREIEVTQSEDDQEIWLSRRMEATEPRVLPAVPESAA